jgi:hypothetical protein
VSLEHNAGEVREERAAEGLGGDAGAVGDEVGGTTQGSDVPGRARIPDACVDVDLLQFCRLK